METTSPPGCTPPARERRAAASAAQFAHSLWGLIRAGATLPEALDAIAAEREARLDPDTEKYRRIRWAIRNEGIPLYAALQAERPFFSGRFIATLALGNLSGLLFKSFVRHLDEQAAFFLTLPPERTGEFPVVADEFREFFYFLGHLLTQRVSLSEVQHWLPVLFSPAFRGDVTYILMCFFDKGLRLSDALRLSKRFQDQEVLTQLDVAEKLNVLCPILLEIPEWLDQRRRLEEQLRYGDMVRPPLGALG